MIGVVLSGQLDDGARGLAEIKSAGGHVMVLRRDTQRENGMPENAAILACPVDCVGSTVDIVQAIIAAVTTDGASSA
jgi:two-component system chemotaxis response regulator CheB